jgi:hypothetical protein
MDRYAASIDPVLAYIEKRQLRCPDSLSLILYFLGRVAACSQ